MKAGESLREGFKLYLANPAIVLPYLLFGIFSTFLLGYFFNFVRSSFSAMKNTSPVQMLLLRSEFADLLGEVIARIIFLAIVIAVIYFVADSFLKAYTIGLAEKISKSGSARLRDGFQHIGRTAQIFGKNIAIFLLLLFGTALLFLTSAVLLGSLALIAFIPALIIYAFIVYAVSFFANQSIVIEKKGPWDGIVSSYVFIKRNMEDVAKLILFIAFVFVAVIVIQKASGNLLAHFYSGFPLWLILKAEDLLLGYIIARPYFIILKTLYFVKNQKVVAASRKT